MAENTLEIGIVSCSGEDCLGGTISRLATRMMLEEMEDNAVTICLPLYLAGGEEERTFAKDYPTITVDGCSKCCAKRATEKYSGIVSESIDVSAFIGKGNAESAGLSTRALNEEHHEMVKKVFGEIKTKFDAIMNAKAGDDKSGGKKSDGCGCGCGCS